MDDEMADARKGALTLKARVTFLELSAGRPPLRFCTDYRSSHVCFAGLAPIECLAVFRLFERDCLTPGESHLAEV